MELSRPFYLSYSQRGGRHQIPDCQRCRKISTLSTSLDCQIHDPLCVASNWRLRAQILFNVFAVTKNDVTPQLYVIDSPQNSNYYTNFLIVNYVLKKQTLSPLLIQILLLQNKNFINKPLLKNFLNPNSHTNYFLLK